MDAAITREIAEGARDAMPWAVDFRRDLHRQPELRFEEHRTAARLVEELEGMDLAVRPGLAGTGVAAVLRGEAGPLSPVRTVALRADMDALPITEATGLPFASERPGVMHACGHDAHVAMVAAAARVLATRPALRAALPGSLKFVFQPAEEGGKGAQAMIADGVLEDPRVHAALGIHVFPSLPTGQVAIYPRFSHASADSFRITFRGQGGHAGYPHLNRDPLSALAETLLALRNLVAREVDPLEAASLTVGVVRAGEADNVVPDSAMLEGNVRALGEELRLHLRERLEQVVEGLAAAHRVDVEIHFVDICPANRNHPGVAGVFAREARALLAPTDIHFPLPTMGAEDFGYYTREVPGAMVRLGCTDPAASSFAGLHSPRFLLDEACLELGITLLLRVAFRLLGEGLPEPAPEASAR